MGNQDIPKNDTTTQILITKIGTEEVEKIWQELGMYRAARLLSERLKKYISPSAIRYMSNKFNWKRTITTICPIYKGVKAGTVPAAYYKHIKFEVNENDSN